MDWKSEFAETFADIKAHLKRELTWTPLPPITKESLQLSETDINNMIGAAFPAAALSMTVVRAAPTAATAIVGKVLTNGRWASSVAKLGNAVSRARGNNVTINIMLDGVEHMIRIIKGTGAKSSIHIQGVGSTASKNAASLIDDISREAAKQGSHAGTMAGW